MLTATAAKAILLVDDEAQPRGILARKFAGQGFKVTERSNGEEGLEAMNHEVFDCILLDLKMPKKDGVAVLRERTQTQNAATPIIVLTSMPSDDASYRARELGADDVLSKSAISPSQVVERVVQRALGT